MTTPPTRRPAIVSTQSVRQRRFHRRLGGQEHADTAAMRRRRGGDAMWLDNAARGRAVCRGYIVNLVYGRKGCTGNERRRRYISL